MDLAKKCFFFFERRGFGGFLVVVDLFRVFFSDALCKNTHLNPTFSWTNKFVVVFFCYFIDFFLLENPFLKHCREHGTRRSVQRASLDIQ